MSRACKEHAASLGLDPAILRFNGVNAQVCPAGWKRLARASGWRGLCWWFQLLANNFAPRHATPAGLLLQLSQQPLAHVLRPTCSDAHAPSRPAQEPVKYEVLAFLRGEGPRPRRTAAVIMEVFGQVRRGNGTGLWEGWPSPAAVCAQSSLALALS